MTFSALHGNAAIAVEFDLESPLLARRQRRDRLERKAKSTFSLNDFHLETVSSDGIFGELSLIDQETRIASAIARTDCTLQVIDKRHFLFLVQETPVFALQVMKVMANRLRRTGPLRAGNVPPCG